MSLSCSGNEAAACPLTFLFQFLLSKKGPPESYRRSSPNICGRGAFGKYVRWTVLDMVMPHLLSASRKDQLPSCQLLQDVSQLQMLPYLMSCPYWGRAHLVTEQSQNIQAQLIQPKVVHSLEMLTPQLCCISQGFLQTSSQPLLSEDPLDCQMYYLTILVVTLEQNFSSRVVQNSNVLQDVTSGYEIS